MKRRSLLLFSVSIVLGSATAGWSYFKPATKTGTDMVASAKAFLDSLDEKQRALALMDYDSEKRVDWHFIPKATRKGVQLRDMTEAQQKAAYALLKSAVSAAGYDKATKIMELETLLNALEKGMGQNLRDPLRYFFTVFGAPSAETRWGLSIEGHHMSLNFVVQDGALVSTTPQFLGVNPAEIKGDYEKGPKKGTRILAVEELVAFELVRSLNEEQAKSAIIADEAPQEIRAAGEPQPPAGAAEGIAANKLDEKQQKMLRTLIEEYAQVAAYEVHAERLAAIDQAGFDNIFFAWAGAKEEGIGHYYRIHGPTFLIEFINTQPDAAGNPANHIHSVWRDTSGDFHIPVKQDQ